MDLGIVVELGLMLKRWDIGTMIQNCVQVCGHVIYDLVPDLY